MGYVEELRKIVGHRPLILVGSVVVIVNEDGAILLQQRTSPYGVWGLPGGLMELGESLEDTARREVYEETGLQIDDLTLIDVFSGPEYFVRVPSGDEFYVVTAAFKSYSARGELCLDPSESLTCGYFDAKLLPSEMVGSHRKIISRFLEDCLRRL